MRTPEVAIYRYVTEGSFDAYMWQALETKARFIAQVMTGDSRRPPRRGHRRPGALLRRGQGDRLGQPGGADAGRGRRRIAAARRPEEEPRRRAVPRPPQPPRTARDHRPAGASASADLAADMATARRPCRRPGHHRRPRLRRRRTRSRPWPTTSNALPDKVHETRRYPLGRLPRPDLRHRRCTRSAPPRRTWKGRPRGTPCSPATLTARVPC